MGLLHIIKPGMMMTVQDRGRFGLLRSGVSPSGPMDFPSFAIANALVGNEETAAALEFAYIGGTFSVTHPALFSVTGGAADIQVDGQRVAPWKSHRLLPGETVSIGGLRQAVWGYLAISGGIATEPVLGSRATHMRTSIGGMEGRALIAGDELPLGTGEAGPARRLNSVWRRVNGAIRVVPGPQDDYFDAAAWNTFLKSPFTISDKRDRMAMMLEGPEIKAFRGNDIVSDATLAGSIQVPGSGTPIVLMADRQTTGGYPKIATVSSVDLPRLAQMPRGAALRFAAIPQARAEALLIAQHRALASVLAELATT
jgi:biotin-dependent carboxylase-like uncharacterized protein